MKQSICYLYEYENYKQTKNVGFVKTSFYKNKVTFQIHGKGLDCDKFMDLEMFLFTVNAETYEMDKVGYVEGSQGAVNYIITVESLDAESVQSYDGVLLESKNEKRYVGTWNKKEVRLESLYVKEIQAQEVDEEPECKVPECKEQETGEEPLCEAEWEKTEDYSSEMGAELAPCVDGPSLEVELLEEHQEQETSEKLEFRKIDRHGISELPQREWKLANNNFLLHGFTNYKHLMFVRVKEKLYLGVPGVYHNREEAVAKSFGFPYFQKGDVESLGLEEIECSTEENFGYWCRPVSERKGRGEKVGGEVDERKGA